MTSPQIPLEKALELVSFTFNEGDGWQVKDVNDSVYGRIKGDVHDVNGDVDTVWGNLHLAVGNVTCVRGNIKHSLEGTELGHNTPAA